MKTIQIAGWAFLAMACFICGPTADAASPPALVNYQGVLRGSSGAPLTGSYDMTFTFYSDGSGGDQILVDNHTGATQVGVAGGLFTTALGSGTVTDGTGPGTYTSLADAFRDYGTVYLEIAVGGETLNQRVQIISSAYALNADNLDGNDASAFASASHMQAPADGGTGRSTSSTPAGSMLYTSGTGTWAELAPGISGQVLQSAGSSVQWVNPTALSDGDWTFSGNDLMTSNQNSKVLVGRRPSGSITIPMEVITVSGSNTVLPGLMLANWNPADPGGAGLGSSLLFSLEGSGSSNALFAAGMMEVVWEDLSGSWGSSLRFSTWDNGTFHETMRIDDNGQAGIGTTSPGAKLDVAGGSIRTDAQLISTVTTGTPPLSVASGTLIPNLNADKLDGLDASGFALSGHTHATYLPLAGGQMEGNITFSGAQTVDGVDLSAGAPNWNAAFTHSAATGNVHGLTYTGEGAGGGLDADTLDGQHASAFMASTTDNWVNTTGDTMTGKLTTAASASGAAGLTLPHGTAPSTPVNGDLWTTTSGLFARINGATVGPFSSASYTGSNGVTQVGNDFQHTDTSSQASSDNSNAVLIQDVTLDTFGHVTGLATADMDPRFVNIAGDTMTGLLQINTSGVSKALNAHLTYPGDWSNDAITGRSTGNGTATSENRGVFGLSQNSVNENIGVCGIGTGDVGTKKGVAGTAQNAGINYGGYFWAGGGNLGTKNYGIYAMASGATDENWAGYFVGDVHITGALTVAGGDSWVNSTGDTMTGKLTTAASAATRAGLNLPHGIMPTTPVNGDLWTTSAGLYAHINGANVGPITGAGLDHGTLSGLSDDDHPQYFNLSQNETVSGIPAFNGGTTGSSAPFSIDSTYVVASLNADLLDGLHEASFFNLAENETVTGIPAFNGGTSGSTAPFTVDSYTTVTNLSADYLDGYSEAAFFRLASNETVTGIPAFNGGTTGSSAPFSVDSTFVVANLNADLLDGQHASAFGDGHSLDASDGTPADVVYVDAAGNVGVGTTGPSAKFEVYVDSTNYARMGNTAANLAFNYHTEDPADGDNQSTFFACRTRSAQNNGTAYTLAGTNRAIEGYNFYGDSYSFGIAGHSYTDFDRSGAVLGANSAGTTWGALGYRASGGTIYGGYFTTSGSGTGFGESSTGIGLGSFGKLMGGWIRGEEYGLLTSGKRFGSFTNGNGFTTGYQAFVQGGADGKAITYSVASPSVDIMIRGTAKLSAGQTAVPFPPKFAELLSDASPVTVFLSPFGQTANVSVASSSAQGFEVGSTDGRPTDAQFAWIAIGARKGYENIEIPAELMAPDFESNMEKVAFDENDLKGSGLGISFDGTLHFGAIPESPGGESPEGRTPSVAVREAVSESRESMGEIPARPTAPPAGAKPNTDIPKGTAGPGDGAPPVTHAPGQALFDVKDAVEPGDVLVLNPANGDELYRCQRPSDPMVVGIAGGTARAFGEVPVFQYGTAWVRVDAQYGPIARGDLLATSATPGHAMKAVNPALGIVVGKALEPLESGTGLIKVLVMLR